MSTTPNGYNNPLAEGNSAKYRTGKACIAPGCHEPAGTAWGPYWCMKHNIERLDKISAQFDGLLGKPHEEGG